MRALCLDGGERVDPAAARRRALRTWMAVLVDSKFKYFWTNSLAADTDRDLAGMYEAARGNEVNTRAFVDTVWASGLYCAVDAELAPQVAELWASWLADATDHHE